jgi:hypothetical protein
MKNNISRTTIGLRRTTKRRLDHSRAPGQCYDGFLCQLINLWEEAHNGKGELKTRETESIR